MAAPGAVPESSDHATVQQFIAAEFADPDVIGLTECAAVLILEESTETVCITASSRGLRVMEQLFKYNVPSFLRHWALPIKKRQLQIPLACFDARHR